MPLLLGVFYFRADRTFSCEELSYCTDIIESCLRRAFLLSLIMLNVFLLLFSTTE